MERLAVILSYAIHEQGVEFNWSNTKDCSIELSKYVSFAHTVRWTTSRADKKTKIPHERWDGDSWGRLFVEKEMLRELARIVIKLPLESSAMHIDGSVKDLAPFHDFMRFQERKVFLATNSGKVQREIAGMYGEGKIVSYPIYPEQLSPEQRAVREILEFFVCSNAKEYKGSKGTSFNRYVLEKRG